jgi:flagellar motility protein MotE (MotC chaperone)
MGQIRLRFLPLLITLGAGFVLVRILTLIPSVSAPPVANFFRSVQAEEVAAEVAAEKTEQTKSNANEPATTETTEDQDKVNTKEEKLAALKGKKSVDATTIEKSDLDYNPIEQGILRNLRKRRLELEAREQEIITKDNLLKATAQKIDNKTAQLVKLKDEVQVLLADLQSQEEMNLNSLVKIYENMKPKDAAAIFEDLSMPVLLPVVNKMKEAKVAPILAQMNPAKARQVTVELAQRRKLSPEVSGLCQCLF